MKTERWNQPVKKIAGFVVVEGFEDIFVPVLSPVAARLRVHGQAQLLEWQKQFYKFKKLEIYSINYSFEQPNDVSINLLTCWPCK